MQINIQGLPVPESKASTELPAAVKTLNPIFTGGSREQSITELPAPVKQYPKTAGSREHSITELPAAVKSLSPTLLAVPESEASPSYRPQ